MSNFEEKRHDAEKKSAENSISKGVDLTNFRGTCPQTPVEARAFGARDTCLICSESLPTALIRYYSYRNGTPFIYLRKAIGSLS